MAHPTKNNFSLLNAGVFIVLILYGLALYFVPLQSTAFYFDDHTSVEYNQAIRSLDLPKIFNTFNTRFLVGLSFALNYQCCGLHPAGYRLVNLLIHCLNAFLVYLLTRSTLGLLRRQTDHVWPAIFGAFLFLCHPIQTEPVNFITQRFVLMGTFFYLLTLYLYIQYRCQFNKKYMTASMVSAVAAMFCKEFVVTLPFMLALYDFYFLGPVNETVSKRCRPLIPFFIIVLIVPLMLLRTPPEAIGVAAIADSDFVQVNKTLKVVTNVDITRAYGGVSRKQYFLTELNVVCTYVRLLFLPVSQNLDYDYPLSHGTLKDFLSGLFLLCLLGIAWVTYRSYRIVSFGILWFFIALSVESSFIPIGHVIAEYRVYLASVGFVFLIMFLIYTRPLALKKLNMIAAIILLGFSVLTFQRNKVWKDEITLWSDSVHKSPHKSRPYYDRGFTYFDQGDFNKAMLDLNESLELNPGDIKVYINRGIIKEQEGDINGALSDYNKAIQIDPRVAEAYYNRGLAYSKQGKISQAVSDFNKTIELNPDYAKAYTNLGSIHVMQGQLNQALSDYNKAIQIYPPVMSSSYRNIGIDGLKAAGGFLFNSNNDSYADVYYDRGCVYDKLGQLTGALSDYTTAILINPGYADAYNNRGYIYYRQGKDTQAIADFTNAIKINPNIAGYYYNRALSSTKQGQYVQAISDLTQTIKINADYAAAYYNRGVILAQHGDFAHALSDYNKVIALNPQDPSAYTNRGTFYAQLGNFTQALLDYNKAIEIKPSFSQAYVNRAVIYFQLKEYDKAWYDVYIAERSGVVINPAFLSALNKALKQGK